MPLLIHITAGYGGILFILIVEYGICARYRKKFCVCLIMALIILSIVSLYSSPERNIASPYPAIFIFLIGFVYMLMLLSAQDAKQSQRDNMDRIVELQLNRKELRLLETSSWTEKTIQSMLSRLVKKGVLGYQKQSRVYVYSPLVSEEDYLEHESNTFLNRFYNGTVNSMIVNLLEKDKLSKEEINALKRILDEKLAGGGK